MNFTKIQIEKFEHRKQIHSTNLIDDWTNRRIQHPLSDNQLVTLATKAGIEKSSCHDTTLTIVTKTYNHTIQCYLLFKDRHKRNND